MKYLFDLIISIVILAFVSPLLLILMLLIYLQDFSNPFYVASRVGRNRKPFSMYKLRSMIVNADKSGVSSTSSNDNRITAIGSLARKTKMDEIPQLFNVITGSMSLVGPRPNVESEVNQYTVEELNILKVNPGITDFASIVFNDEGSILLNSKNPDLDYNRLIRPPKNRLALIYIKNKSFLLDIQIIIFTAISIIKKDIVLNWLSNKIEKLGAEDDLVQISKRVDPLTPSSPPGS